MYMKKKRKKKIFTFAFTKRSHGNVYEKERRRYSMYMKKKEEDIRVYPSHSCLYTRKKQKTRQK